MAGRKVVVTGGAGFIGSHLVDLLLARGNQVTVVDDFSSGTRGHLLHHRDDPRLRVAEADILQFDGLRDAFEGADYVFHLATRCVRLSLRQPTTVHDVNTTGTLNALKAAVEAKAKRFLYCSSSEVNGTAQIIPMPEDYHYRPETIYGASKLAGEYYALAFHRSGWLEATVARPHNNYGPREHYKGIHGEVIPRFILRSLAGMEMQIFGDGTQTRDFTYVRETAEYLIRLLETDACTGGIFNVCRGDEVSINQIATLIADITGANRPPEHLPGRPSDVLRLFGDNAKLRQALGDAPQIGIRSGLEKTIAWFREHVPITSEVKRELASSRSWLDLPAEDWLAAKL